MRLFLDPKRIIDTALLSYRHFFGVLALFSGVINLLVLAPTIYMMQVYDRVLVSRSETTLWMLTFILLGLFLLGSFLEWVRSQLMVHISAGLDEALGEQVFNAAFHTSLAERGANPAQALSDLGSLRQFLTGPGLIALFDAPWIPIYLIASYLFHPSLGMFALVGALVMVALAVWNELSTQQGMTQANQYSIKSSLYLNSSLQNAEVIQAMGMLAVLRLRWRTLQERMVLSQTQTSHSAGRIAALTRFMRMSWQSLALGLGALLVMDNEISSGVMIAVTLLVGRTMSPVEQAIGSWKQLSSARNSYTRLSALLDKHPAAPAHMTLPAPTGQLRIERLVVVPPGSKKAVVAGINFFLQPGEVLAVIGASASGKSSLLRAIAGIWPAASGSVRLDEADINQWSRELLGPHLGYLPQDIELFDGTIAENIARFSTEVDAEKVIAAAQMAGIHDMVLHFPQGYDTALGVGGLALSGGQKQRVGLARALYGTPPMILLDEPNSNLDEAGDAALLQSISALKAAGSTVIIVTHRPGIFSVVDKLLFMKDGEQKLFGPREQVMKALLPATAAVTSLVTVQAGKQS
jgi:ATP-binding cassette subfamily C exporter for protease/lipase